MCLEGGEKTPAWRATEASCLTSKIEEEREGEGETSLGMGTQNSQEDVGQNLGGGLVRNLERGQGKESL